LLDIIRSLLDSVDNPQKGKILIGRGE